MQQLTLYVTLSFEYQRVRTPSRVLLKAKKIAAIVATALGEVCEILLLSTNLTSLEVNYFELGAEDLTTGNGNRLLECLG